MGSCSPQTSRYKYILWTVTHLVRRSLCLSDEVGSIPIRFANWALRIMEVHQPLKLVAMDRYHQGLPIP